MTTLSGLVLDVDDTLYLERDYVRSGFARVGEWLAIEHGVHGVGDEAWRLFAQGRRRTTIGDALGSMGGPSHLLAECVEVYRLHRPGIELMPDARQLLEAAAGSMPLAVVTDGPAVSQRAKCDVLGIGPMVNRIVITDELGMSKPDRRVFQAAVEGWAGDQGSFVYVADNPAKDFVAPLEMGWRAIRVRRRGSLHQAEKTPSGVLEVDDLTALADDIRASTK